MRRCVTEPRWRFGLFSCLFAHVCSSFIMSLSLQVHLSSESSGPQVSREPPVDFTHHVCPQVIIERPKMERDDLLFTICRKGPTHVDLVNLHRGIQSSMSLCIPWPAHVNGEILLFLKLLDFLRYRP
ncbi:hypothetical protein BXZ70DRAFT_962936, partial [Cristinia sonorae]